MFCMPIVKLKKRLPLSSYSYLKRRHTDVSLSDRVYTVQA